MRDMTGMQWQHSREFFWKFAAALVVSCWASGADAVNGCRRQFAADATRPGGALGNVAKMVNVWNARTCGLSSATNRQDYDMFDFVEWIELMQCTGGDATRDLFRDPSDRTVKDDYDFAPLVEAIRGVRRLGAKPYLKLGNVPQKFTEGFDGGEFSINTMPPDDWEAHFRYMRAFASALVAAFGRDEVRSWRFALLTEADNHGWFMARSKSTEDSFAAYCRLYRETYRAFAEVLGTGFAYGTHVLGEGYGWKRWTADQFCAFCEKEGLPLDIVALSFYDTVGKTPHAQRLEDQVIGVWRKAAAAHGFKRVIWGYDEGRIITGAKGRNKSDIASRAVGDTYQAAYDARLAKNLFDLGVDYFANWVYFTGENALLEGIPAVNFHVAREVAKFRGMRRVPFVQTAAEGAEEQEEGDGVAAVSADGSLLRAMVYNFRNQLAYARPAEIEIALKTAFPAGTRVKVVRRTVDDSVNWFDDWECDRRAKGIRDEDYFWSPDGYCLLAPHGLIRKEHRDFFKAQLPRYAAMVRMEPEIEERAVAKDGTIRLGAHLRGNAVVFFEVRRADR